MKTIALFLISMAVTTSLFAESPYSIANDYYTAIQCHSLADKNDVLFAFDLNRLHSFRDPSTGDNVDGYKDLTDYLVLQPCPTNPSVDFCGHGMKGFFPKKAYYFEFGQNQFTVTNHETGETKSYSNIICQNPWL